MPPGLPPTHHHCPFWDTHGKIHSRPNRLPTRRLPVQATGWLSGRLDCFPVSDGQPGRCRRREQPVESIPGRNHDRGAAVGGVLGTVLDIYRDVEEVVPDPLGPVAAKSARANRASAALPSLLTSLPWPMVTAIAYGWPVVGFG